LNDVGSDALGFNSTMAFYEKQTHRDQAAKDNIMAFYEKQTHRDQAAKDNIKEEIHDNGVTVTITEALQWCNGRKEYKPFKARSWFGLKHIYKPFKEEQSWFGLKHNTRKR